MADLTDRQKRALRSHAQTLQVTVHVGKAGISDQIVQELDRQLKERNTVKVRLLGSSRDDDVDQAKQLADATRSQVIDRRGHTVVLHRR